MTSSEDIINMVNGSEVTTAACDRCGKVTDDLKPFQGENLCKECYQQAAFETIHGAKG